MRFGFQNSCIYDFFGVFHLGGKTSCLILYLVNAIIHPLLCTCNLRYAAFAVHSTFTSCVLMCVLQLL